MKKISFKLSFILLTLVILSAHSCGMRDKDKNGGGCHNPKPEVNNLVVGIWRLQSISQKSCKVLHIPTEASTCVSTEIVTKSVVLTLESNNSYFFITDGVRTSQGTYSFSEKNSKIEGTPKQFLDFSNDGSFILDTNNGKLALDKDASDWAKYSYVR